MQFNAKVYVTLKRGVLDPQGQAVSRSLRGLGFEEVGDVRIGKYLELELDAADAASAHKRLHDMCEKLIANTVIEDYRVEVA